MRNIDVSIISPAHNEELTIVNFVDNAACFLKQNKIDGEIVIVENGSKDKTRELLKNLQKKYSDLRVINQPVGNKGVALKEGLKSAKGKYLITVDTDLWDSEFAAESIKYLKEYDVVVGSKTISGASDSRPLASRLMNLGYNFLMKLIFNFQGTDSHAKLSFKKESILPLAEQCLTQDLVFDTELILRAERVGLRKIEIPTSAAEVRPRVYSVGSQLSKTIKNTWVLIWALGITPHWPYVILSVSLILGLFLRFYHFQDWFFFEVDEEHYAFMTRMITADHHFPLIGGPISGTKLYMAPWFLYFNAIWFWLSRNSILVSGAVLTAISSMTSVILYFIGKKIFNKNIGALAALLYATSFLMVLFDRHSWNITLAPFLSALIFLGLLYWRDGSRKWLIILSLVMGFALSTTFSLFAVFLFVLIVILIGKKPVIKKDLFIFLGIIILSHLTLVAFDLRHGWWLTKAFWEFLTVHPFSSIPIFSRVVHTGGIMLMDLGKSLAITSSLDVSNEISICQNIPHYIPGIIWPLIGLGLLIGGGIYLFDRKVRSNLLLIYLLGLVNFISLFIFRTDSDERHWLTFLPLFLLLTAAVINRLMNFNKVFKGFGILAVCLLIVINVRSLIYSYATFGLAEKEKVMEYVRENTQPGKYYLDSLGYCHRYGYRYLASWLGNEPAGSFIDGDFAWMYSQPPYPQDAKVRITISPVGSSSRLLTDEDKIKLAQIRKVATQRKLFGNVEVLTSPMTGAKTL